MAGGPTALPHLEEEMDRAGVSTDTGGIVTFRDPRYSPDRGGYHPVEIAVGPKGRIEYVTDLSYCGKPPHVELQKDLDFDFSLGLFQHLGREYPIVAGHGVFTLWERNFLSYYESGVYEVSVEPMG